MSYELYTYTGRSYSEPELTSFYNRKTAPDNIKNRTDTKYSTMLLSELKEKGLWNSRLDKIIPLLPPGTWIGGGFLRAMIAGEDELSGDIDFFFNSENAFNQMLDMIKYPKSVRDAEKVFGYYTIPEYDKDISQLRLIDCESLVTFRPHIQLVRLYWFDEPSHVIDSFDFTACQFITDGYRLWYGPNSFDDAKNKVIRIHRENGDPVVMLNRSLKYMSKGYKMDPAVFESIEKRSIEFLNNPEQANKYFYLEKTENDIHKRPASFLQRAWDYLETAPGSAEIFAKIIKEKQKRSFKIIDKQARQHYSSDLS